VQRESEGLIESVSCGSYCVSQFPAGLIESAPSPHSKKTAFPSRKIIFLGVGRRNCETGVVPPVSHGGEAAGSHDQVSRGACETQNLAENSGTNRSRVLPKTLGFAEWIREKAPVHNGGSCTGNCISISIIIIIVVVVVAAAAVMAVGGNPLAGASISIAESMESNGIP